MKYIKITLLLIFLCVDLHAGGMFNVGFMAGAADDAGGVDKIDGDINMEMRSTAGATVAELDTTYSPVFSINLGYVSDSLMIQGGWEYTTNVFYKSRGSIKTGSTANEIEVTFSRFTVPLSLGIAIPLTDRDSIYFAGGVNMSYVILEVKQSSPSSAPLSAYPAGSLHYTAFISGSHLKCGGDIRLSRNYSFAMEFTQYFGNTKKVENEEKNSKILLGVNSFEITAGINYNIDI